MAYFFGHFDAISIPRKSRPGPRVGGAGATWVRLRHGDGTVTSREGPATPARGLTCGNTLLAWGIYPQRHMPDSRERMNVIRCRSAGGLVCHLYPPAADRRQPRAGAHNFRSPMRCGRVSCNHVRSSSTLPTCPRSPCRCAGQPHASPVVAPAIRFTFLVVPQVTQQGRAAVIGGAPAMLGATGALRRRGDRRCTPRT